MDKQSYLEKYNEEHSSVAASLTINKKILTRLVGFVICSILYFIIYQISKNRGSHDIQTQFINSLVLFTVWGYFDKHCEHPCTSLLPQMPLAES